MKLSPLHPELWSRKAAAHRKKLAEDPQQLSKGALLIEARLNSDLAPKDVDASEIDQVEVGRCVRLDAHLKPNQYLHITN